MIRFGSLLAITLVMLSGCATKYGDIGMTGGVEATKLEEGLFRIHVSGNGYTNSRRMEDFVMLKAAEVARQNGYTHYVVLDEHSYSKTTTTITPGSTNDVRRPGSSANTYTPPTTHTTSKPRTDAIVRLVNNPDYSIKAIDANAVYNNLAPKYLN